MPEPPQLAPLDVEEQRLYSELLPSDRAPHPISKGRPPPCAGNSFLPLVSEILFFRNHVPMHSQILCPGIGPSGSPPMTTTQITWHWPLLNPDGPTEGWAFGSFLWALPGRLKLNKLNC